MELQNLIHPKENYAEFIKLILQAAPEIDDRITPQMGVDMYNRIQEKHPVTMAQMRELLPKIIMEIKKKMGGEGPSANNLEALQSVMGG